MEKVIFYNEWLPLPKPQFNILYMLADCGGSFSGTLADMCRYFHVGNQTKNKTSIKNALDDLTGSNYITCGKTGYTYDLKAIPKEEEVQILRRWLTPILKAETFSESIAKAPVIKSLILISQRDMNTIVTNEELVQKLNISVSTFGCAKNVLEKDFHCILREIEKVELGNGEKRNVGQRLGMVADWTVV